MKPRVITSTRIPLPLASAIAALFAPAAFALPYNWTGATNGTWNTAGNWSGVSVPLITDDLTILGPANVAGALTIDFDANNSANSLNFTNTAATSVLSTTGGRTLTLGSGGITTGAGAVQIGANSANAVNITLGSAQTWNVGAGGLTVTNFVGGVGTGLTKTGAGNLTFNTGAGNGFTGGLNVNGGTVTLDFLNLTTPTNLIAPSNALQINNGTLTITGRNVAAATTAQTFASTSLGAGRNNINIAKGALATSATLNLGALTVAPGSVTAFSPTTAWTTTASTTERVFITAGGSVPTLPVSGSQFVNGLFHRTGAGAGAVRWAAVNSSGQLLAGAALGTLTAGFASTPTAPVQFSGASSLTLTNAALSTYGLLLNTTSNGLTLTLAANGTYTLNSILQQQSANAVTIAAGTGTSNLIIGSERNLVINMDGGAGVTINAPIANNGGGASSVTIASTSPSGTTPGNTSFGGANTYTGATYIAQGTLTLNNVNALGGNNPGVNGTSGIFLGSGSGASLSTSTTGITLAAPITTANTGVTSTISFANASGGSIALNGAIGGNGNVAYTTPNVSSGGNTNTINLGAAGTYAGNTSLNTGNINNNLVLRNASAATNVLPISTVLTFGTGLGPGAATRTTTLDLNGQNQTLAGLGSLAAVAVPNGRNHRVSSTNAATLTINSTADQTFGGTTVAGSLTTSAQITGAISLVKNGAGTFTLGGLLTGGATASGNAFTGSTTVLGGILVLGETRSIQNSAFDTTASVTGTLTVGLRTTVTALTLGGLTGGNDFATRFTTTTGGYTGLTALTLNPGTGVTNTYTGDIGNGAGAMTLTKTGLGTQVLSVPQTYTGATTVSAGKLVINGNVTTNITVQTTGTLGGNFTTTGGLTIESGGTLSTGNSIGSDTAATVAYNSGSTTFVEINSTTQAADLLTLTGTGANTLTITNGALLTLGELGTAGDLALRSRLTLIDYLASGAAGWNGGLFTFGANLLNDGEIFTALGYQFAINYDDTMIGGGISPYGVGDVSNGGTYVTLTVVPEPRAALLGGLGMLALLRRRRN